MSQPSMGGPLNTLGSTLRSLGFQSSYNSASRGQQQVAEVPGQMSAPRRGRAVAGNGLMREQMPDGSFANTRTHTTRLLSRPSAVSKYLSPSFAPARWGGRSATSLDSLGMVSPIARSVDPALQPKVAIRSAEQADVSTRPAGESPEATEKVGTDMLVQKYVQGRRRDYLELGRQHFRNGEYRKACDFFKLAQSVSLEEDKALIDVKVALLHAAVASQQHSLAVSTLQWLISPDPRTGEDRDEELFVRIGNVRSLYAPTAQGDRDYSSHILAVEAVANQGQAPEMRALRAVVLWGQGDRANALHYARSLAGAGTQAGARQLPWVRLVGLMEKADKRGGAISAPVTLVEVPPASQPASHRLPFENGVPASGH